LAFANKIGEIADKLNHHPTLTISWGKVVIQTTTHDEGNVITQKDLELTKMVDKAQAKE